MASDSQDAHNVTNPDHAEHHLVTPFQYGMVYVTLLVGTALTWGVAYIDLGIMNPVVALLIACGKAAVVLLFFMHVKFQSRLIQMTLGAGIFTFLALICMTMADYMSRAWGRW